MRCSSILAAIVVLVPSVASAEALEVDRFEPVRELELLGLQGIDVDTGWQPPSGGIQVRFLVHADDDILVEMPGDAVYDWDTGELYFAGDENGGVFDVDIGIVLDARFRFDLLGQQFESSFIGPYDLGIFRSAEFTPYVLPGNDDRPVRIDDQTTPIEVFNYAIVDALIASGNFFVDASFDIDMQLACDAIDVADADGVEQGSVVAEFDAVLAGDPDADLVELEGSLHCVLVSDVELVLYPGVELQIGFEEFQLVPFDLRVPLLEDRTDPLDFEAVAVAFDMPPEDIPEGTTGDASETEGGSSTSGTTSASDASSGEGEPALPMGGSTGDVPDGGSSAGSSGSGAGAADGAEGCACGAGGRSGALWAWSILGLFALPRRRRIRPQRRA